MLKVPFIKLPTLFQGALPTGPEWYNSDSSYIKLNIIKTTK